VTNLTKVNLTEANLVGANLTLVNLTEANLVGANLTKVDLTEANLVAANLTGANLVGANLTGASLVGANLTKVDFTVPRQGNPHWSESYQRGAPQRETQGGGPSLCVTGEDEPHGC
jgi:uncharacterized protein YjbI with pentapeptide repeats